MPLSRSHSAGFTLIEVMVALSLLALGVAGTAKLTEIGYRQIAAADEARAAAYLAHSHLNALSQSGTQTLAQLQGRYNERFRWQLSLNPVSPIEMDTAGTDVAEAQTELPAAVATTTALRADLVVWMENDTRSMNFHTLILSQVMP